MSSYSENMLQELVTRSQTSDCSLFEAASDYCKEHDLDEEDFIKGLDRVVVEQLKASALSSGMVRKCVERPSQTLV